MIGLFCAVPAFAFATGPTHATMRPIAAVHPRSIRVWVSRDVAPGSKIQLTINTENVPVVHAQILPIDGEKWFKVMDLVSPLQPRAVGRAVAHYDITVRQKGQVLTPNDNYFSRQVNLPPLHPGVYVVRLTAGPLFAWGVVDVTNMEIVIKRSPTKTLCWVTDFKTGRPIRGALIHFYDPRRTNAGVEYTGKDGTSLFPTPAGSDLVVFKHGKDLAGIVTGAVDPDGRLRCLFETDRPIYRPGQTLDFKAILRLTDGQGYDVVRRRPVAVELRDPRDNPLDRINLTSNSMGSVAGRFKLSEDGLPGAYTLVLTLGDQQAYQTITVAAYRKPEFKVSITPSKPYFLSGEDVSFNLDAEYYFGAPVPQARVDWMIRSRDASMLFGSPDQSWFYGGDGNLYPSDTYGPQPFIGQGTVTTDSKGHAQIVVHTDRKLEDSIFSLSASITDSDNRQVTADADAELFKSTIRIGVETLKDAINLGGLVPIRVHVETIQGQPAAARIRLQAFETKYDEKSGELRRVLLASKYVDVPTTGVSYVTMPALANGEEIIIASGKDGGGRATEGDSAVWVAGLHDIFELQAKQSVLTAKLDRRTYLPGQRVYCFVQSNTVNRPVLIVLEGGDIWAYKVVYPRHSEALTTFPTSKKESPNGYVEACQWTKNGLLSTNAIVPLPDKSKLLTVSVKPDRTTYEPGDKATYIVRTINQSGKGVSSEVALAVVDEAIYALMPDSTPDPYGLFWGLRQDQVNLFQSAPQQLSGGAYQNAQSSAPVRSKFVDTAYWNPFVETNSRGKGEVSFEMPGNLTQWRATARAVTNSTQVGMGSADVVATRPLTLRLATPRIMTVGDEISLTSTVDNRTDRKLTVKVSLAAKGAVVSGNPSQTLMLVPHGEGSVQYRVHVDSMPKTGSCSLTGRATAVPSSRFPGVDDAVMMSVPIVPRGVTESGSEGGLIQGSASPTVDLPSDAMSPGSTVKVKVFAGIQSEARVLAENVIRNGRFGTYWAIDALNAASAIHYAPSDQNIKDAFALLSRDQNPDGWGWWDGAPTEADITASVGMALANAKAAGLPVYDREILFAASACDHLYAGSNLWNEKARLAAALLALGDSNGPTDAKEVLAKGQKISPYAWLQLACALHATNPVAGAKIIEKVIPLVSDGPARAYLPVGFGIGWNASATETTAQLLLAMHEYGLNSPLQSRLTLWLALSTMNEYPTENDIAAIVSALAEFGKDHPDASSVGSSSIAVNGHTFPLQASTEATSSSATVRAYLLHGGANSIRITRSGTGTALYTLNWTYYRPLLKESTFGLRVVRRFEVRNAAGVWKEIHGPVKANEPVRCTVMIWGDSIPDAIKVSEPLPAGFAFVDSDYTADAYQAVLDGRVVHYLLNQGSPIYFRYYLRPEEVGNLVALPATAEFVRRPAEHGQSSGENLTVNP